MSYVAQSALHAASSSFCTKINNFKQSNKIHKKLRTFYSNSVGATKLRKFELIEILEDAGTMSKDLSDYVRKDELKELIIDLLPGKEDIVDEQSIQSTQPTIVRRTVAANK